MTAGLPGFTLAGIFFIISALLAPFGELNRSARGRSSRARWASVGRQLLMAVAMILAGSALLGFVGLASGAKSIQGLLSFSLLPLTMTTTLLAFVLVSAKLVQLCSRGARRGRRANFKRRLLGPLAKTELALALVVATALVLRGRDAYELLTVTAGRDSATAALAWFAQGAAEINAPAGSPGLILVALALVMTTWTLVPLALARRLVRSASAVSLALIAAGLIAVWGGELQPGLPSSNSTRPSEASARTQNPPAPAPAQSHPQSHQSTRAVRTASPSPAGSGSAGGTSRRSGTASGTGSGTSNGSGSGSGTSNGSGSGTTDPQGSNPKPTAPQPVQSPSTPSTPPSTSQDQGTTPTTGAPTDSPGNVPSGSELPGQLP
jgi:hypothetical protein